MSIRVENITKKFGAFTALDNINLETPHGQLTGLLGPSGSGKTTLLRIIAGLETPDDGRVYFEGVDTTQSPLRERGVGFVFQHYALFRHMTVFDNIAFGLRVRPRALRPSKAEIKDKVMTLLRLVQLENLAFRYPSQLSGGQRQRVALARALAVEPKVMLLDEPFGALDAKVRKELRRWLRRLHDEIHLTSVFVTHDQEEALEVSDQVVVMNHGKIEQVGTPDIVYNKPASPFVYDFLGDVNFFHGRVDGDRFVVEPAAPGAASAFVRPHELDIEILPNGREILEARIHSVNPAGPLVKLELGAPWGDAVQVSLSRERYLELNLAVGQSVYVTPKDLKVFVEDYVI